MTSRAHIFFAGRVQGVFFRSFTQNQAIRLGLGGWVKNLRDGRVEAVFEGEKDLVEEAVRACRKGPAGSMVRDTEVLWEDASGENGFEIRY
jgi:acylphosphatase